MAGIGFRLQKLFQEDYFSSRLKAFAFAGLVTSGPWLIIITSIACIQWLTSSLTQVSLEERELFNIAVSYCFIFSQVLLGLQQLIVTRYVADLFYEKQFSYAFSTCIGMSKITLAIAIMAWGLFAWFSPLPFLYKLALLTLFITINLIWVLFLFLSAAKNYQAVAYSFAAGGITAIALVYTLGQNTWSGAWMDHSTSFLLIVGFTMGMLITLFGLFMAMLVTFPIRETKNQYQFLSYYDKYPSLFWTGFLYNMGIWVCNWVIWFGEGNATLVDTFIYNRVYDTAIFWSYLTIIPTLIIFVVSVETRFYERYRVFYGYINEGGTLQQIKRAKSSMRIVLRQEMERLIRSQGIVTLLLILTAGYLFTALSLEPLILNIFRLTTIGAFSNGMVLVITLLLLYFEDRRGAMYTSILFFCCNLFLSVLFLPMGVQGYGLSFSIGSTIAFLYSIIRLIVFLQDVDYHAFCRPHDLSLKLPNRSFTRLAALLDKKKIL
ncbi:exopolysaccharide Pel transporter PelG [Pontibacillus salicampi]|uniref:Exopolysaccharide Pel transporter PelG n=1 Tax=Pontibacillus salicampi TaxID=1449801 RepID=A0ABV6LQY3_9BACI